MSSRVHSISSKVTGMIIGVSTLLALVTMLIQFVWNYLGAVDNAKAEIRGYSELILPSIAQALWDADRPLLNDLVLAVSRLPAVSLVELSSLDGFTVQSDNAAHSAQTNPNARIEMPVMYEQQPVATLRVVLSNSEIYRMLWQQMVFLVLGNGIKTLVMAFVILSLLKHLVIGRLARLSAFANTVSLANGERIHKPFWPANDQDEIGSVGRALEAMYHRLRSDLALIRMQQRQLARRGRALSHTVAAQDSQLTWLANANSLLAKVSLQFLAATSADASKELNHFTRELGALLGVERVSVLEFVRGKAIYRSFWSSNESDTPASELVIDNLPLLKQKFGHSHTLVIEDIENLKESSPQEYRYMKQVGIVSAAGFAIADGDTLLGVLSVANRRGPLNWTADKTHILTQFASALNELWLRERHESRMFELQQELLRANMQLAREAETDPLTGLTNRRPFTDRLSMQLEQGGVLLMADVDFFKGYNDTYGHVAGDDVLKKLAVELQALLQDSALLARIGGEEFALIAPVMSADELEALCDGLLTHVRNLAIEHKGSHFGIVTLSLGAVNLDNCSNVRDALSQADASLYLAKQQGRNLAVINGRVSPKPQLIVSS
ncbi:GGDEF domain-containing protein [Shewanella zhangzhouensis]|uniref:GGDEF domain-containing protein n=1 Tax=Shewanella zhangzhouensis TaxID=2864213 RepID=UPI001C659BEB|nr:sensor domain-containing diguanylate cyclase [Shewanella zhangzhouensis]QYK04910.1 sensor domain-containing diguanylate cyclase [Shewanella zhangzhouensis]